MFDNINDANRYATKHTKRLESFGFGDIRTKIFEINYEPLYFLLLNVPIYSNLFHK